MHFDVWGFAKQLVPMVATVALGLIARALHTPRDWQRAQLLAQLASDVTAGIVAKSPAGATFQQLVEQVIQGILSANPPTSNADAIRRAAAGALVAAGKVPAAP
jgi:hypothetical protein